MESTDYSIEIVWPKPTEGVRVEVVGFWAKESAVAPDEAAPRSRQLACVARNASGEIAGVSTAKAVVVPQLGFSCFNYRSFVGRRHRTIGLKSTDLARRLLFDSYHTLNTRYASGRDPEVLGLFIEVENRSAMRRRNELVWNDFGANVVYVGRSARGCHCRVWYFEGARLPGD